MVDFQHIKQAVKCDRLLADRGITPTSFHSGYLMYHSPLRLNDAHPSFSINLKDNRWRDHATGDGGDVIDLALKLGIGSNLREAAERLEKMYYLNSMGNLPRHGHAPKAEHTSSVSDPVSSGIVLIRDEPIVSSPLKYYVVSRGIPFDVANRILREIHFRTPSGKEMYGLGLRTQGGGFSIRSALGSYKTVIKPAGISVVGSLGMGKVAVFEGMFDYLSYLVDTEDYERDAVILNSVSHIKEAIEALSKYDIIDCYLDRDTAGANALLSLKRAFPGKVFDRSARYQGYNDYNEYLVNHRRS